MKLLCCARLALAGALLLCGGCYQSGHAIQWDSRSQIWQAELSQVKVRSAQSRVFDSSDRTLMLEAVVGTFQDLGFQVEVLDEQLGIVSGKKFVDSDRPDSGLRFDPHYFLYDEESLVVFTRAFRGWGPFWHRSDLVRLTVTVRARNEGQLIVRASAQCALKPIEDPEPYQGYFKLLEQSLFGERQAAALRR